MAKVIIKNVRLPKKKIEKIIKFVTPKNLKLPPIYIQPIRGKYVIDGVYYANDKEIYLKVAHYTKFPFKMITTEKEKRMGYLDGFILKNKEEAFTFVLAHEIRHCYQARYPHAKRLGKRKNKYSESDADIYALQKLQEWRKMKKNKCK